MTEVSNYCDYPTHPCKFEDVIQNLRNEIERLKQDNSELKEMYADKVKSEARAVKGLEYYAANLPHHSIARTILDDIQRRRDGR